MRGSLEQEQLPADKSSTPVVGFVGAGSMGAPMVERLLRAGHDVRLFVRRPAVADRFRDLGATIVDSLGAAARSDVLILCPFSDAQLAEIAEGDDGLLANVEPGAVIVQHATVSLATVERFSAAAEGRGATLLDAPISGTADSILAGRLTVLVGGGADAVSVVEPVLASYASTVVRTGEVGTATKVKLVNNIAFAAQVQTVLATIDLGEALGVPAADLVGALRVCSANSDALGYLQALGGREPFAAGVTPYLRKDVATAARAMRDLGSDTGLLGEIVRTGPVSLAADE